MKGSIALVTGVGRRQGERALKAAQQQLTTLFEMRLGGEIEGEEYKERRASLEAEERRLKGEIESIDQRHKTWIDDVERLMTFAERASEEFAKGGVPEKRAIIAALGDEHVLDQGILTMNTEKPIQVLLEASSLGDWIEPQENEEEYTQKGTFVPSREIRWRWGVMSSRPNLCLRTNLRRIVGIEVSTGTSERRRKRSCQSLRFKRWG